MEWIDNTVDNIVEHWDTANPFELCKNLRIKVVAVSKDYPLLLGNDSIYVHSLRTIYIRDDLPYRLQCFYICHELGHALLHPNIFYMKKNLVNTGKQEKQADYFAYSLLGFVLDEGEFYQVPITHISSIIGVPERVLKRLVNM